MERRAAAGWETGPKPKLLKRIVDLILNEIPADPGAPVYEQGNTLGADARGWRRAKFLGRFRLFFRFDSASQIIVYAWVNDANTLRKSGSATDPYAVFRAMLVRGDPPHDWERLLEVCRAPEGAGDGQDASLGHPETLHEPPAASPAPAQTGGRGRRRGKAPQ